MIQCCEGSYEILTPRIELREGLERIEWAGRTCYQSYENKTITQESAAKFCRRLLSSTPPHESVLEHAELTVRFTGCSRGMTHELVRHRLCAFSQESTRYVDYIKDTGGMRVVPFPDITAEEQEVFDAAMEVIQNAYRRLREMGRPPEDARQVLPTALVSEIVVTANWREWRHIFELRCDRAAHWEIRRIMVKLLEELKKELPGVFDDFVLKGEHRGIPYYQKEKKA